MKIDSFSSVLDLIMKKHIFNIFPIEKEYIFHLLFHQNRDLKDLNNLWKKY